MAMERTTRREFLGDTGRVLAGAGALALGAGGRAEAAEPAKLPVGVRDSHLKQTGEKDPWKALDSIGAACVEATIGEDLSFPELSRADGKYSAAMPEGIARLAADLKAAGKAITAFCMYNQLDTRPELEVEWCVKAARAAQALGTKAIRIDVWPHKLSKPEFLVFSIKTLKTILERSEDTGVCFGIENHGHVTNDPDFLRPLFDGVGSKRLGLTLDTGNFYWFGHPLSKVYSLFEAFASRVFHTHCKSIGYPADQREVVRKTGWEYEKYNCPIDRGDIDFQRVVKILRGAGYSNDLCIEDESLGKVEPKERGPQLARQVEYLKRIQ